MKSTSIFLSSRVSTTPRFFRFLSIHQLVIHETSPPLSNEEGVSRYSSLDTLGTKSSH
jgi:hypothetical protein